MLKIINRVKSPGRYERLVVKEGGKSLFRKGSLEYCCGMPVLILEGDYYEMGLQYGVLLKDGMGKLYNENRERGDDIIKALPWYIKPFGSLIMSLVAGYSAKRIPRKYRKELSGLSRGSGIPFNEIATAAFGGVIFDAACTAILARVDDGILHGQNLDFEPSYLGNYPVIAEYRPPGKNRYVNFGISGVPGMSHGVNERGISLTVNYGDGTFNRENRGLPMGYKIREILESCSTLDETEAMLRSFKPDELGWILTVCSAEEKSAAVFDIFNGDVVRSDLSGDKHKYVLNRIFCSSRTGNNDYSKKYLQISRGEGIYNIARVESAEKSLKKRSITCVDDMLHFLADYDFYHYKKIPGSMNTTIVNERTLHTLIFDWRDFSIYFASAPGYSSLAAIYKYNFKSSSLEQYRDPLPEFGGIDFQGFMEWYSNYQKAYLVSTVAKGIERKFPFIKFKKPDYSRVLDDIDLAAYHNPRELWSLFRIWKSDRRAISFKDVIFSCEKAIEQYPDFAILYTIKGSIEASLKRFDDAIRSFSKALECGIISDYDRIHIYNELVTLYKKNDDSDLALDAAVKNIKLIESLSDQYSMGSIVSRIYDRMKYYAYKPEQRYNIYHR
jgi:hypothetical protein